MLVGKSHKIIPLLEDVSKATNKAHILAIQSCQEPTKLNAIEVRIAVENIQYKIDMLAMSDAK